MSFTNKSLSPDTGPPENSNGMNFVSLEVLDWISKSVFRIFCPKRRLRHN
jgi:hypothetical protein